MAERLDGTGAPAAGARSGIGDATARLSGSLWQQFAPRHLESVVIRPRDVAVSGMLVRPTEQSR